MLIKKNSQRIGKIKIPEKKTEEVINTQTDAVQHASVEIAAPAEEIPQEDDLSEKIFDIDNLDFTQRIERRSGTGRRGYRRIDDRKLVSRAKDEADIIKKNAFDEGYKAGIDKANEDLEEFRTKLNVFLTAKKEVFEYIAPDILEISVDIAKKIIKKEVTLDPQVVMNIILDILKSISKTEPKILIKVNPAEVQFVKDSMPNTIYELGLEAKINITGDENVQEGGCILETSNGIVDASIDAQLEIIRKALRGI